MGRSVKIYLFFFVIVLAAMVAIDMNTPKPLNWSPTYGLKEKQPFGLYVLNKELPELLKHKITKFNVTPYEYLETLYDYDSLVNTYTINGTILGISDASTIDEESAKELMYFAEHGNTVFLSMKRFPQQLLDSLKIKMNADISSTQDARQWLAHNTADNIFELQHGISPNYFSSVDTLQTDLLGYQSGDSTRTNFIRVRYKSGNIYLHTQPAAFTNFHLLKDNHSEYAQGLLSYIPEGDIYWHVKGQDGLLESSSQLRYIFSEPALKSAWFIFLFGMMTFLIFNAKRRQRIVPVIKPLQNTTVDFAKTIGNLYLQEGDHSNLIEKKIIYFLEKVRLDYLMDTTVLDDNFIKKLNHKTGKDAADIERLIYLIKQHRKNLFASVESDLIEINTAIEKILN